MSRALPSLAHALSVAPDLNASLIAMGEALMDGDRSAVLALLRYDGRKEMLRERLTPSGGHVESATVDTTFDHLPPNVRVLIAGGGQFVDLGERSVEYARLFGLTPFADGGLLSLRGLTTDGQLAAVLALYEQRKMFGTRTSERFASSAALFDLAYARFADREARDEAVNTLEAVTQKVHGDYLTQLGELQTELTRTQEMATSGDHVATDRVQLEQELRTAEENARRANHRANATEQQLMAAVGQLEQAHVELHRRHEALRQKTRTLYLLERALALDNTTGDPGPLVDGLLAMVGDDLQAQRCSMMLRSPEPDTLYLAAARGLLPHIRLGQRTIFGKGVAGIVAMTREPLLVQDVTDGAMHPLLRDEYLTTGSFISFPLVYHGELLGVVNLTNRAKRGVFIEEDVERVRLLGLVISLIVTRAQLVDRLLTAIDAV
ncbi:MAG TPA: GAF domain-containing protein [Gemmatimonadaceae bacterium]|nr:GAF domain-containing protein [Gemmatimonadaceae bacterium]